MTNDPNTLKAVLTAAKALLEARHEQMVTSEEWDSLKEAVLEADPTWTLNDPTDDPEFEGIEFPNAGLAIQHANADPQLDTAILLGGRHYAVAKTTAERLAIDGVPFAYVNDHEMPDGTFRIVTVPVNDD